LSVEPNDQRAGKMTVCAGNRLWHPVTSALDISETTNPIRVRQRGLFPNYPEISRYFVITAINTVKFGVFFHISELYPRTSTLQAEISFWGGVEFSIKMARINTDLKVAKSSRKHLLQTPGAENMKWWCHKENATH